ncbi:MAG: PD-(D/E)XK nuclease family protein [Corallococcus sp.]|nr:PD-(D/E)XK nuclease family protein [Corallococcus sp.]MCM1359953.1 PD-(D/E)XK nuclease family protein [Corallococcus sp.]MCM1395509.1 PD-(D/E)XK nuclease family protein [Corallococcus sp.]
MITIFKTNSMKNAAQMVAKELKRVDKTNLDVLYTVIVPDRASLEAERALLAAVGGSFNVQVRTFRRLANEILPKYDYLSKQAGIMALAGIIQDNKSRLTCFTKGVETEGFVSDMYETISMLKYCRISPETLTRQDLPKGVAGKAQDVALLYRAYCDYAADKFIDSADKMDLLRYAIPNAEQIKNGHFFLYDFDNFSAQELALVEQLALCARSVTVACCVGGEKDKYLYLNDIFNGVMNICRANGITPHVVEEVAYANSHTRQIGENMFRYGNPNPLENDGFAELFCGTTRVQEVYALACNIQRYVRGGGRFKDVYVVTSDIDKYSNAIATVFEEFDIPYFCDRQFCLADHPYARFVLDYFSLCRNNAKLPYVLPFVKNCLFCGQFAQDGVVEDCDDVFHFENYCLKYNVSYDYSQLNLGQTEEYFPQAQRFGKKFDDLYKKAGFAAAAPAVEYIDGIRNLIAISDLNERNAAFSLQQQAAGLEFESKVTLQAQQKFDEVLAQAEAVLGGRFVKAEDFLKMLSAAISSVKISVIPVSNDCVVFANMAKARKHDIEFLALLGANMGAMPIVKGDNKLFSDRNMAELTACGVNVEPQVFTENKRERFSLFQLLLEPARKLYVSYAQTDGSDVLSPSPFVGELQTLFCVGGEPLSPKSVADEEVYTEKQALSKVVLNTRKLADNQPVKMPAYELLSKRYGAVAEKFRHVKDGKKVTVGNGEKLYLKNFETSVSKLTDFYKCPYRFYLQYGLGVKPRDVANLDSADLGNILHAVLELYVRDMAIEETDEQIRVHAEKCFEQALSDDYYRGMRNNPQLNGALEQLKNESLRMCAEVKKQLVASDFVNLETELAFGSKEQLPPVEVNFGGGKFLLIGKIDRVDVKDGKFIVIDYKSGAAAANFSEKDLYVGHKLQLLVYLKAVQTFYGFEPAGFYYFNMHDNFTDVNKDKVYSYNGRTLNDAETVMALDKSFQRDGESKKLGIKLKKDGTLSRIGGKLLEAEQFQNQMEYSVEMIKQAGQLMRQGYAAVSPYKGACGYCDYKDVCDFGDVFVYDAREVTDSVDKDTIDKTVEKWRNTHLNSKT